jgi:hypothetical protein
MKAVFCVCNYNELSDWSYNLFRSGFKTSSQAQFLCWADGFNTRNIKYIPALEFLDSP